MGRSFFHPSASRIVEDFEHGTFYHETSRTWFEMLRRGDRYFQRRYQIGLDGKQTNVEEKSVDFILGSGNHSRTYLHLTSRNLLQQLPLAWYAESGGHWGMNPGYDQAAHPFARRVITYECIGCHNAYPSIPQGHESLGADPQFELPLPEGIDCRRCHGPGQGHVEAARKEHSTRDEVRHTIVNPARLGAERQMEVCLQCHLETDSSLASHSILRYSEGPFSYKPGQPLGSYRLFLDRTGGTREFQIAQGAYRFRESACFIKTGETFQCTACHDPHSHAKNTDYRAASAASG